MKWILFLSLVFLATSCAGYQFKRYDNPFAVYQVDSVTVPMFYNYSSIPAVSGPFTREITLLLSSMPGLRVSSGFDSSADAVLVGIISSSDFLAETLEVTSTRYTVGSWASSSLGEREGFYVPARTRVNLHLSLVLIKRPSAEDLELLRNEQLAPFIDRHPRVVLTHQMRLNNSFSRVIANNTSVDSGGVVNLTQNQFLVEKGIQEMAQQASANFRELVLNVF